MPENYESLTTEEETSLETTVEETSEEETSSETTVEETSSETTVEEISEARASLGTVVDNSSGRKLPENYYSKCRKTTCKVYSRRREFSYEDFSRLGK